MHTMSALKSTALLTAVSLFSQAVGFVYRVLLSRTVGSEVMGLYQLVMPVSAVLMSLTAVGFTAACSNLTARYRAAGNFKAAGQVLKLCVGGFLTSFALVALLAAPLSDAISVHLLGDARSRLGLLLLLPCVLLTGLENIHKHSFYGAGRVRPPAFSEICEQVIRAGAVLGLLWRFLPQNPERTVGLIVCGMILCEIFSAVTLTLLYRRFLGKDPAGEGVEAGALRRQIAHIALPMGLTSLLGNLMGAATAVLIPQRLVWAGADVPSAMGQFGVLCGMTLPLLTLPTAFLSAMGLVLLPRMARSSALGRMGEARLQADRAITAASWLVLPASALLAVLAPTLGQLLFREESAGQFAVPLALAVVLSSFESVLAVCLNGLGRQTVTARNGLLCGAVQLSLTWYRMGRPGVGLRGYVEALVVSSALGALLNGRSLKAALDLPLQPFRWLVVPGLGALLAGSCVRLLLPILLEAGLSREAGCGACFLFGVVLYLSALAAQGVLGGNKAGRKVSDSP